MAGAYVCRTPPPRRRKTISAKDMLKCEDFKALPERVQDMLKKHHAVQQKLHELHHSVGDTDDLISKGKSLSQKFAVPSELKSVVESGEEHLPSGTEDLGKDAAAELKKHSKDWARMGDGVVVQAWGCIGTELPRFVLRW